MQEHSGNPSAVALALGVTLDETKTRAGKSSKNQTPVVIYSPNFIDDSLKMHIIGYANLRYAYSKSELLEELRTKKKCTKVMAKKLLAIYERQLVLDYLYDILSPLLKYQDKGLKICIGGNKKGAFDIVAFPHLVMLTGDTKELDYLAGTSWQKKSGPKCRLCTTLNFNQSNYVLDNIFRDDASMYEHGVAGLAYIRDCYLNSLQYDVNNIALTGCNTYNLSQGSNRLISLFHWQYIRKIHSFYRSLVPDYLHTTLKGILEYTISWCMHCIYAVSAIDPQHFGRSSAILDERIKHFPRSHSMYPVREYYFGDGIRDFFNDSWRNEDKGTGFFRSGNIETWMLPSLLLQIMLCINKDIVPFSKTWSKNNIRHQQSTKCTGQLSQKYSVGKVLLKTLSCSLDFHFCCKSVIMVASGIDSLKAIIKNLNCNLKLLWMLKYDLVQTCKKDPDKKASKGYRGIKMHLIEHYPYFKRTFGADSRPTDTELSEQYHKLSVKSSYELTNKHVGKEQYQMLINLKQYNTTNNIYAYLLVSGKLSVDKDADDEGTGNEGSGDQGLGDEGLSDEGLGDEGLGDQGLSDQGLGYDDSGDDDSGNEGSGNDNSSDKVVDDDGLGDQGFSDQGLGYDDSSDKGSGDQDSSDEGSNDEGSGDEGSDDEGSSDEGSDDEGSGDEDSSDEDSSDEGSGDEGSGDENLGDEGSGDMYSPKNISNNYKYTSTIKNKENPINRNIMSEKELVDFCTTYKSKKFQKLWKGQEFNYVNSIKRSHDPNKASKHDFTLKCSSSASSFMTVFYKAKVEKVKKGGGKKGSGKLKATNSGKARPKIDESPKDAIGHIVAMLKFGTGIKGSVICYHIVILWLEITGSGDEWPVYKYTTTKKRTV